MRELTLEEIEQVTGGQITSQQAGAALAGFTASVLAGAAVGAMLGGPGGMVAGAIVGAGRAAVTSGTALLGAGAYYAHYYYHGTGG